CLAVRGPILLDLDAAAPLRRVVADAQINLLTATGHAGHVDTGHVTGEGEALPAHAHAKAIGDRSNADRLSGGGDSRRGRLRRGCGPDSDRHGLVARLGSRRRREAEAAMSES